MTLFNVVKESIYVVDDNIINVESAARLGLVTRRVVGVEGARGAFVELGLLAR